MPTGPTAPVPAWRDVTLPIPQRVADLVPRMTLREKIAQLCCTWIGVDSSTGEVAPHQGDMENALPLEEILAPGLGQLTRPFGTDPVEPAAGAKALSEVQRTIVAANRLGIPAMAHEECLAGFTAWQATCYPVPLSWGATFNPQLVRTMARQIGDLMRSVGVHQGLAPVLDVARDLRWGRVEETIGEDPYLVATTATAYVQGLESAGIVATLKHFAGYSTSKAGRNLAPAAIGRRELLDVILPPFEMAVREGGVRSVMQAYNDIEGVPVAANRELLTGVLRDQWGFEGTVVADYFAIGFLKLLHGVAETWGDAARLALTAGLDVEMPNITAYGDVLYEEVRSGRVDEALVDRALTRVLRQKAELGLLDPDWDPVPAALHDDAAIDFDPPEARALARELAEQAVVLVKNDGLLPLPTAADPAAPRSIAVIGPVIEDRLAMLGCYSFPGHKGVNYPDLPIGVDIPTMAEAVAAEFPAATIRTAQGCPISEPDTDGIAGAVDLAASSDLTVLVLGDRAGLFGRGTSGEGCDAPDLRLPGVQAQLLEAVLDLGRPTVVVLLAGRPYALGSAPERARAIVQTFFPGEAGAEAVAGVVSGRVNPSGRLPVSIPAHPGSQPSTYLGAPLTHASKVSNIDPTPAYPFGHGLSYSTVEWSGFAVDGAPLAPADPASDAPVPTSASIPTDGRVTVSLEVANASDRATAEIVQLYLHDPVASVVQPVIRLVAYARVELAAGERKAVAFTVPADLAQFTGLDWQRVVEPGVVELRLARSSGDVAAAARVALTGPARAVGLDRERHATVETRTL